MTYSLILALVLWIWFSLKLYFCLSSQWNSLPCIYGSSLKSSVPTRRVLLLCQIGMGEKLLFPIADEECRPPALSPRCFVLCPTLSVAQGAGKWEMGRNRSRVFILPSCPHSINHLLRPSSTECFFKDCQTLVIMFLITEEKLLVFFSQTVKFLTGKSHLSIRYSCFIGMFKGSWMPVCCLAKKKKKIGECVLGSYKV